MSILVIDVGTSGAPGPPSSTPTARVVHEHYREVLPDSPMAGLVEFDARVLADTALEVARHVLAEHGPESRPWASPTSGPPRSCGDRATGEPVGPALGWQDLRTVGDCLVLQAEGLRLAPNQSATKIKNLLDTFDPDRFAGPAASAPSTPGWCGSSRRARCTRPT